MSARNTLGAAGPVHNVQQIKRFTLWKQTTNAQECAETRIAM